MKAAVFILLVVWVGVTGCGRKSIPVSSNTETTTKKDSTTSVTKNTTEKIIIRDSLVIKTLPSATVGITLTKSQLDSLTFALGNLPGKTAYYTDPKLRAQLQLVMDSLGRIQFNCKSLEQTYFEKYVKEAHYRETLINELTKVNLENQKLVTEIRELQKTPWEKIKAGLNNLLLKICLAIIAIGLIVAVADWIKRKLKALINPFK